MFNCYSESNYENAVLELLIDNLEYTYIYGPDIERDYHSPLYEDVLMPCLKRVNPGLPMEQGNSIYFPEITICSTLGFKAAI